VVAGRTLTAIDPFAYFKDVLARLPTMNSKSDFSVLLPANWKPAS
jgi:hypothetical protein